MDALDVVVVEGTIAAAGEAARGNMAGPLVGLATAAGAGSGA